MTMGAVRKYVQRLLYRAPEQSRGVVSGYLAFEGIIWGSALFAVLLAVLFFWLFG